MTVMPGGLVIPWPLRVPDYYNYELVEIRFPVKLYTSSYSTLVCQLINDCLLNAFSAVCKGAKVFSSAYFNI